MSAVVGGDTSNGQLGNPYAAAIMHSLAGLPETQGMGVILAGNGGFDILRRPSPPRATWLIVELDPANAAPPPPPPPPRPAVDKGKEWRDASLSCGGAVLAGVGAVPGVLGAPETAGASLVETGWAVSQAVVAGTQCSVSVYRLWNIYFGDVSVNEAMDRNLALQTFLYWADFFALLDVPLAGQRMLRFGKDVAEADVSLSRMFGKLNRNERLRLTEALQLVGARRVASAKLTLLVKLKIAEALGAGLTLYGSGHSDTGILRWSGEQLHIWVVEAGDPERTQNAAGSVQGPTIGPAPPP